MAADSRRQPPPPDDVVDVSALVGSADYAAITVAYRDATLASTLDAAFTLPEPSTERSLRLPFARGGDLALISLSDNATPSSRWGLPPGGRLLASSAELSLLEIPLTDPVPGALTIVGSSASCGSRRTHILEPTR